MKKITLIASVLTVCWAMAAYGARGTAIYVAPDGNDAWSGRAPHPNRTHSDGPFRTLERARGAVRTLLARGPSASGPITIWIAGGTYALVGPLELGPQDSGSQGAPVTWRAQPGQQVRISGGIALSGFEPVKDPAVLERLDASARGHVLQVNLASLGLHNLPGIQAAMGWSNSRPGVELFFEDRPMTLARWPNRGFARISGVAGSKPVDIRGVKGDAVGAIKYEGDRPLRWVGEKEVWLHGYWFWDWADERERVERIDPAGHTIYLQPPYHAYGYRPGQWFYAENVLSELDEPGEYMVDHQADMLYFWPPGPLKEGRPTLSLTEGLLHVSDARYVTFRGLIFEDCRGTAITVQGGSNVRVVGCVIRNTGSWAVSMAQSPGSEVEGCDIYGNGDGGVILEGGDRITLTPARMAVDNCHIHHYARWNPVYKPAVMVGGVGNRVTHNLIDNAPHMAIGFGGNDHLIEYNEIHSVCYQSNDAGAMYAGRNWTMRGTIVRYNYLHDISGFEGRGCVGVYLDDQFCGTQIYGNVFWKVTRAAMIGGGRDCSIVNNIFVDCVPALHIDARGLGWAADGFEGLKASLEAMPYRRPPWSDRYPQLVNILQDDPMAPKGNVVERNICVGGRWGDIEEKARKYVQFRDNMIQEDPGFVNAAKGDFRLKPSSRAWAIGFRRIPVEKIGLYRSPERASWPVTSKVRPAGSDTVR
ncbi:MAG: right-handed parallel beta-helix repeat-containing protein [Chthonomonadales bacterium]